MSIEIIPTYVISYPPYLSDKYPAIILTNNKKITIIFFFLQQLAQTENENP